MPAPRLPWFRFWLDATSHEKVRQLDDATFRTWVELLDAAAKQPQRGRFASRQGAVAVVRRPAKHIGTLIAANLIDESPEGLTMHDWDEWQRWRKEDANDSPTTPEHPPNGRVNDTRTTTEHLANSPSLRVRAEGDTERDTEKDVDRDEDVTPLALRSEAPPQVGKPTKTRRPISNETIDGLVAEYGPQFGDEQTVRDWIARALNHTARLKCLDEALYVERTWLKPELAKIKTRAVVGSGLEPAADNGPISQRPTRTWLTCSRCGREGYTEFISPPLCSGCGDVVAAAAHRTEAA